MHNPTVKVCDACRGGTDNPAHPVSQIVLCDDCEPLYRNNACGWGSDDTKAAVRVISLLKVELATANNQIRFVEERLKKHNP